MFCVPPKKLGHSEKLKIKIALKPERQGAAVGPSANDRSLENLGNRR